MYTPNRGGGGSDMEARTEEEKQRRRETTNEMTQDGVLPGIFNAK